MTARQREARANDPEKHRAWARTDYARHRERYQSYATKYDRNAMIRDWKRRHPELQGEYSRQRQARKLETMAEWIDTMVVAERDHWMCGLCNLAIDPALEYPDPMYRSIDHIVPLARGGTHTYDNVQLTHLICNVRKGATTPEHPKRSHIRSEPTPN
jgi:5-methylcytosine-specific restriction endonuclease McrA